MKQYDTADFLAGEILAIYNAGPPPKIPNHFDDLFEPSSHYPKTGLEWAGESQKAYRFLIERELKDIAGDQLQAIANFYETVAAALNAQLPANILAEWVTGGAFNAKGTFINNRGATRPNTYVMISTHNDRFDFARKGSDPLDIRGFQNGYCSFIFFEFPSEELKIHYQWMRAL